MYSAPSGPNSMSTGRKLRSLDCSSGSTGSAAKPDPSSRTLILQHALKADAVVQQVIALGVVGKVAAGDQLAAGRWAATAW